MMPRQGADTCLLANAIQNRELQVMQCLQHPNIVKLKVRPLSALTLETLTWLLGLTVLVLREPGAGTSPRGALAA